MRIEAALASVLLFSACGGTPSGSADPVAGPPRVTAPEAPPPPVAEPETPPSSGTERTALPIRSVFKGSFGGSADQIDWVANRHELRILNGVDPSLVGAVHRANPKAVVYTYLKVGGLHFPDDVAPAGDPGWEAVEAQDLLWYGPSGRPVTHPENAWYWIDLIDEAKRASWIAILTENIRARIGQGFDAVFLDNACVVDPSQMSERPASYSDAAYYQAVEETLAAVRAAFPERKLLINSYMGTAAPENRGPGLLAHADGLFFEGFSTKSSTRFFFDRERYLQQLHDFAGVLASEKTAVAMDYGPTGDVSRRIWSLATFLLVNSPGAFHYYTGTDSSTDLQFYPENGLAVGAALGDAEDRGDGLVVRAFDDATVVVNPSLGSVRYPLGDGGWQTLVPAGGGAYPATGSISWSPIDGDGLTLASHTAAILRRSR